MSYEISLALSCTHSGYIFLPSLDGNFFSVKYFWQFHFEQFNSVFDLCSASSIYQDIKKDHQVTLDGKKHTKRAVSLFSISWNSETAHNSIPEYQVTLDDLKYKFIIFGILHKKESIKYVILCLLKNTQCCIYLCFIKVALPTFYCFISMFIYKPSVKTTN